MGVSRMDEMRSGNVSEIDTPFSVCLKCGSNVVIAWVSENEKCISLIRVTANSGMSENMDTPDTVFIQKVRKAV